jgi:aspartate aminotransferase
MRVDAVSDSPVLSLIDQIFRMRGEGASVLGLHIGEPDFETPVGIREAAYRAMNDGATHYVSAQGVPTLREAIANRLRSRHGVRSSGDDVVVLPAKFAIYATLLTTISEGEEVLLPDPTYLFEQPIQLVGGKIAYAPLRPDFSYDIEAIRSAVTPRTRVLLVVTPSNPTGRLLRRPEAEALVELARERQLTIVSDETYESLVYDGTHVSPAAVADGDVPVVTIGSFSKTYAMTGWRVGYAVAPPAIVARLVRVIEHTLTCVPPFAQAACEWALANAGPDEERFRREFRSRRDHLLSRLASVDGLSVVRPEGAFYIFPKYDLDLGSVEFCGRLLAEERLALVPGVAFGPRGEGHVRLSYSSPIAALDEGVDRLERFLRRHRATPA